MYSYIHMFICCEYPRRRREIRFDVGSQVHLYIFMFAYLHIFIYSYIHMLICSESPSHRQEIRCVCVCDVGSQVHLHILTHLYLHVFTYSYIHIFTHTNEQKPPYGNKLQTCRPYGNLPGAEERFDLVSADHSLLLRVDTSRNSQKSVPYQIF